MGEVKRVMKKWLEGDLSGWEGFIPAIQMGLNDRVISRHRSHPFSLVPIEHLRLVEEVLDESEEVTYEVEKILDHRGGTHERLYKVKWKGHKTVTWELPSNFNSKEFLFLEDSLPVIQNEVEVVVPQHLSPHFFKQFIH